MVPLFKSLVRPILEYANPVWSPYLRKHVNQIENVQRQFTKRIQGLGAREYEQSLHYLKLPSLEHRRLRGDLLEVYKIVHNFYDPVTTKNLLTPINTERTRGHEFKLTKLAVNTRQFGSFFTNRIVSTWNNLPPEAVKAQSLNSFKNHLDNLFTKTMYSTNLS